MSIEPGYLSSKEVCEATEVRYSDLNRWVHRQWVRPSRVWKATDDADGSGTRWLWTQEDVERVIYVRDELAAIRAERQRLSDRLSDRLRALRLPTETGTEGAAADLQEKEKP